MNRSPDDVRIRALEPGDRAGVVDIIERSFAAHEIAVALELIDESLAGSEDYLVLVAGGVAGIEHGIGGYLCYGPTPMTRSTFDLYWIACHPDARGRGLAGALVQAMERSVRERGGTHVRVETSETESFGTAQRLYQRHHYPEAGRLRDFYAPGDGLILYYKRLP